MDSEVKVLIVDDSALMRNLIGRMIADTPGMIVADKAMNGKFALDKIPRCNPDIICLDIEMPEMNGIEFLKERKKRGIRIPVVVLSSVTTKGAEITMEALSLGASDFRQKPSGSISDDIHTVKDTLTSMLLGYGGQYRRLQGLKLPQVDYTQKPLSLSARISARTDSTQPSYVKSADGLSIPPPGTAKPPTPLRKPGKTDIIAIGISTGGPDALRAVFSKLDADLNVPIVVVQHMPPGFTKEFAQSLDRICPLEVKEAAEGDAVIPGRILIAQGNKHLEVEKRAGGGIVHLTDAPLVSGHRPSADVLFASVAKFYGNHALGVIMTGMGRDGAEQIGEIYKEGGLTIGQDGDSSVVYGMPRVAFELGHVQEQVSLQNIARRICDIAKTPR
jgi:two-component system chemotaxis response regulator CheB